MGLDLYLQKPTSPSSTQYTDYRDRKDEPIELDVLEAITFHCSYSTLSELRVDLLHAYAQADLYNAEWIRPALEPIFFIDGIAQINYAYLAACEADPLAPPLFKSLLLLINHSDCDGFHSARDTKSISEALAVIVPCASLTNYLWLRQLWHFFRDAANLNAEVIYS